MSSPQVQQIISRMTGTLSSVSKLGGTIKLDFGAAGSVLLDGRSKPASVSDGDGKSADTTVFVTLDTWQSWEKGDIDQTSAYMQGKMRVDGDIALALKLGHLVPRGRG